ncbi:MAG: hypothetical protein ABIZ82_07305 [Candidatus Tumulicola sp.]
MFAGFALILALVGVTPAPPSAEEFYARAVGQMRSHPEPAFARYDASIGGLNCTAEKAGFTCTLGKSTAESEAPFATDLRQSDGRVALHRDGRSVVFGDSTFLNATWPGVDALIRHGFTGMGSTPPSTPPPSSDEAPSSLPVIAVVSTLSVANYNVYDAGAATCPNGDGGHALRLVARHDPSRYPLTGATVDLRTGDLCALRFNANVNAAGGLVGATSGAQIELKNVGGYDVVTHERFDIDLRAVGIAVKHLNINVAYSNFTFPESIAPQVFVTPTPSIAPHGKP